jgi:hypothetical protein
MVIYQALKYYYNTSKKVNMVTEIQKRAKPDQMNELINPKRLPDSGLANVIRKPNSTS